MYNFQGYLTLRVGKEIVFHELTVYMYTYFNV
jgi:hypothetical protein